MQNRRISALAKHLDTEVININVPTSNSCIFNVGSDHFMVLENDEIVRATRELWECHLKRLKEFVPLSLRKYVDDRKFIEDQLRGFLPPDEQGEEFIVTPLL